MGLWIYSAWLSVICVQKTYWPCFPPQPIPLAQAVTPWVAAKVPCCCSWKISSIVRKCHIARGAGFPTPALKSAMHQQRSSSLSW